MKWPLVRGWFCVTDITDLACAKRDIMSHVAHRIDEKVNVRRTRFYISDHTYITYTSRRICDRDLGWSGCSRRIHMEKFVFFVLRSWNVCLSYAWHDSSIRVTWFIYTCDMPHSRVRHKIRFLYLNGEVCFVNRPPKGTYKVTLNCVLQCVDVRYSVLQCVAVYCMCCSVMQYVAVCPCKVIFSF